MHGNEAAAIEIEHQQYNSYWYPGHVWINTLKLLHAATKKTLLPDTNNGEIIAMKQNSFP